MNKMLVCDFDDTVYTSSKYINYMNVEALKKFRNNGNTLVIASGRDFNSLKRGLERCSCQYDALICNDGSTGFNQDKRVIFEQKFTYDEMDTIIYLLEHMGKKYINDFKLFNRYGYTYDESNIIEISVVPVLFKRIKPVLEEMKKYVKDLQIQKVNMNYYLKKGSNKSDGIKEINNIFKVDEDNIYTVGDGINDYEMIRDYNGYNMLIGHPALYKVSKGTVSTVAQLVKKINK